MDPMRCKACGLRYYSASPTYLTADQRRCPACGGEIVTYPSEDQREVGPELTTPKKTSTSSGSN